MPLSQRRSLFLFVDYNGSHLFLFGGLGLYARVRSLVLAACLLILEGRFLNIIPRTGILHFLLLSSSFLVCLAKGLVLLLLENVKVHLRIVEALLLILSFFVAHVLHHCDDWRILIHF